MMKDGRGWTKDRVRDLYRSRYNVPEDGPHPGEPHEWEWEDDGPPICLGCSGTGDEVEALEVEDWANFSTEPWESDE